MLQLHHKAEGDATSVTHTTRGPTIGRRRMYQTPLGSPESSQRGLRGGLLRLAASVAAVVPFWQMRRYPLDQVGELRH